MPENNFIPPSDAVEVKTSKAFVPPSDALETKKKNSTGSYSQLLEKSTTSATVKTTTQKPSVSSGGKSEGLYTAPGNELAVFKKEADGWYVDNNRSGNFIKLQKGDVDKRVQALEKDAKKLYDADYEKGLTWKPEAKPEVNIQRKTQTNEQKQQQELFKETFKALEKDDPIVVEKNNISNLSKEVSSYVNKSEGQAVTDLVDKFKGTKYDIFDFEETGMGDMLKVTNKKTGQNIVIDLDGSETEKNMLEAFVEGNLEFREYNNLVQKREQLLLERQSGVERPVYQVDKELEQINEKIKEQEFYRKGYALSKGKYASAAMFGDKTIKDIDKDFKDKTSRLIGNSVILKEESRKVKEYEDNLKKDYSDGLITKEQYEEALNSEQHTFIKNDVVQKYNEMSDELKSINDDRDLMEKTVVEANLAKEERGDFGSNMLANFAYGFISPVRMFAEISEYNKPVYDSQGNRVFSTETLRKDELQDILPGVITDEYITSKDRPALERVLSGIAESLGSSLSVPVGGAGLAKAVGEGAVKIAGKAIGKELVKKTGVEIIKSIAKKALLSPQQIGLFASSYMNFKDQINSDPNTEGIDEADKVLMSGAYAYVSSKLESLGMSKWFSKTPAGYNITSYLLGKAFKDLPKNATQEMIDNRINSSVKALIAKGAISLTAKGNVEGTTEALQELADIGIKSAYNEIKGEEVFKNSSFKEIVGRMSESYKLGMIGGTIMSSVSQTLNTTREVRTANEVNNLERLIQDPNLKQLFEDDVKTKVLSGQITKEQARAEVQELNESIGLLNEIPDNVTDKTESFRLLSERKKLEQEITGKDENLVAAQKARIADINNQLKTISEDATKKSTEQQQEGTAEGGVVQRQGVDEGQPEVGQGEGAVGQATEQVTDLGNRPVEGSGIQEEEIASISDELKNIDNENELARLYNQEVNSQSSVDPKERAIRESIGKIRVESYNEFGDPNNITTGIAKTYFNKNGSGIDQVAQEASNAFTDGLNNEAITPEDVIQYINKYPTGFSPETPKGNAVLRAINERYIQLTGKGLNSRIARIKAKNADKIGDVIQRDEIIVQAIETAGLLKTMDDNINDEGFWTVFPGGFTKEEYEAIKKQYNETNREELERISKETESRTNWDTEDDVPSGQIIEEVEEEAKLGEVKADVEATAETTIAEQQADIDAEVSKLEELLKRDDPNFQLDTELTDEQRKDSLVSQAIDKMKESDINDMSEESFEAQFPSPEVKTYAIDVKENSKLASKLKKMGLKDLIGKKINLVMADQLKVGEVMGRKRMGGPFFPLIDELFGKVAWASMNQTAAQSIINGAVKSDYTVVYNMNPSAIDSNVAITETFEDLVQSLPKNKQKLIFSAIQEQVLKNKYATKTDQVRAIAKSSKTLTEFFTELDKLDVDTISAVVKNIMPSRDVDAGTKIGKLLQDENITIESIREMNVEQFASELPAGALTMVIEVTDKSGKKVTKETAKEAIITPEQQDAEGLPRHKNYPIYVRGKAVAMLNETVPFWNILKESINNINVKVAGIVREKSGRRLSSREAVSNEMRSASMTASVAKKVSEKMNTQYSRFVSAISQSFPNVEVVTSQEEFDNLLKDLSTKKLSTKNAKVYGAVYKGKLYLNPSLENYNTPIHEFGHIWINTAKLASKQLYDKGISLVKGSEYENKIRSSKAYQRVINQMKADGASNADIDNYIYEEALATAVGDKGESFVTASQKLDFKNWMKKLFSFVKSMTGISKYTSEQLENITLDEFTQAVSVDIMSGTELFKGAESANLSDALQLMTNDSKSIEYIISTAKNNNISDAAIREYLKRKLDINDKEATEAINQYNIKEEDIWVPSKGKLLSRVRSSIQSFRKRYLSARSFLPRSVFGYKEQKEASVASHLNIVDQNVTDFNRLYDKYEGNKDKLIKDFDAYIRGDKTIELPEKFKILANSMRNQIDGLSRQLIDLGLLDKDTKKNAKTKQKIEENLGKYLTRSYRVYDNANWKNEVEEEVKQRALNFMRTQYKKMAEELSKAENMSFEEALNNLVNNRFDELLDKEGATNFVKGSRLGSKDLSVLKEKQDIPFEIRALMGEYQDPALNYARTVMKLSSLAANHKFLTEVKDAGMGKYFFEKNDPRRGREFNTQIATEKSETMNPLNGLYTTKEIAEAFEAQQEELGALMQKFMKLQSGIRWAKTIGSIGTHFKNVIGNLGFIWINAHYKDMGKAYMTVKEDLMPYGTYLGRKRREVFGQKPKESNEVARKMMNNYIKLGIVKQSAGLGEIRDMFKDANFDTAMASRLSNQKLGLAGKFVRFFLQGKKKIEDTYQAEDDFFKIVAYENELARYSKAMFGKSKSELTEQELDEVNKVVTEIVKNTYPTYDRIPEAVKMIRRFPFVGNFVSFQAEAYRTAFNTIALAKQEVMSKDPSIRKIGAIRLAGATSYLAAKTAVLQYVGMAAGTGLTGAFGYFFDDDDEEEKDKDIREFVAPWSKESDLLVIDAGNGKLKYIDFSATDPHGGIKKAINAFLLGESTTDSFIDGLIGVVQPFIGEEMTTEAILALKNNRDKYGKEIWNPEDNEFEKIKAISVEIYKLVEPGTISSIRRGIASEDKGQELVANLTGFRTYDVDINKQFGFKVKDYSERIKNAKRIYNSAFFKEESTKQEKEQAYKKANNALSKIYKEVISVYNSAERLGVDPKDLKNSMIEFGDMSKSDISKLQAGEIPDLKSKEKKEKKQVKQVWFR